MNPGDLIWTELEALGDCTVHDRTPSEETVARAAGAEVVLTNKVVLDADVLSRLPDLKYIGVLATGYNVVDIEAASERGIVVTNVPEYSTESVAQLVFAHVLNFTHHVADHSVSARGGKWAASPDVMYWDYPLVELSGLVLGVVGFGRIGRAVARIGRAFGMRVLAYDAVPPADLEGCEAAELDDVFRRADVLTLHCPLTPDTEKLVNRERLALMVEKL